MVPDNFFNHTPPLSLDEVTHYCRALQLNAHHVNIHQKAVYQELTWWLQISWHRYSNSNKPVDFTVFLELPGFDGKPAKAPVIDPASHYGQWLKQKGLETDDYATRLLLATTMALSLNNGLFFSFLEYLKTPVISSLVGGHTQQNNRRFLPTLQTVFFLLAGTDLSKQNEYQFHFRRKHAMLQEWGFDLQPNPENDWANQLISLQPNVWLYFLGGNLPQYKPLNLPVTRLETSLTYQDLVLPKNTQKKLTSVLNFVKNRQAIFNDEKLGNEFKQGHLVWLHGEPGTGKALIAQTIGKEAALATYQFKLAQVVAQYKDTHQVFDILEKTINHLQNTPSILLISQADILLKSKDNEGDYARVDIENLLQKLKGFPGLVVFTSSLQQRFNAAIKHRINKFILVPRPEADERTQLWKNNCPPHLQYPTNNFARTLGEKFALTGSQIRSVIKQVVIDTYGTNTQVIDFDKHLEPAIKTAFENQNKLYERPHDLMNKMQLDAHAYEQQLLWERALLPKWQYKPTTLPVILSQSIVLAPEEIEEVVKKVKRAWNGEAYHDVPFNEGLDLVLRELCVQRGHNWNDVRANILGLLAKDKKNNATPNAHKTVILPSSGKSDETNNEGITAPEAVAPSTPDILSYSKAEWEWRNILPEGYRFERGNVTSRKLAQMYALTKEQLHQVMHDAVIFAQKARSKTLMLDLHFTYATDKLTQELGKEDLYTDSHRKKQKQAQEAKFRAKLKRPNQGEAVIYWANALPFGYSYEGKGMAALLGKRFGPFSYGEIDTIVAKAKEIIDQEGNKTLALSLIEDAMRALKIHRVIF